MALKIAALPAAARHAPGLSSEDAAPRSLAAIAYTARLKRRRHEHRLACVVEPRARMHRQGVGKSAVAVSL